MNSRQKKFLAISILSLVLSAFLFQMYLIPGMREIFATHKDNWLVAFVSNFLLISILTFLIGTLKLENTDGFQASGIGKRLLIIPLLTVLATLVWHFSLKLFGFHLFVLLAFILGYLAGLLGWIITFSKEIKERNNTEESKWKKYFSH